MRNLVSFLLVISLGMAGLFISGCGSASPKLQKDGKPEWVLNPNVGGKRGAVGVAGKTYDQHVSSQRKLAISRALDELAMQQGVDVKLSMQKEEHMQNEHSSTSIDMHSDYKTKNASAITAHIEDVWQDPYTGELYVWLVLD